MPRYLLLKVPNATLPTVNTTWFYHYQEIKEYSVPQWAIKVFQVGQRARRIFGFYRLILVYNQPDRVYIRCIVVIIFLEQKGLLRPDFRVNKSFCFKCALINYKLPFKNGEVNNNINSKHFVWMQTSRGWQTKVNMITTPNLPP